MVEIEKLEDMIQYQKKSVVSRTIIDKPKGTVTLFAFGEGEGLSEHTSPYDALVYVYDGKAIITISGVDHEANDGETIIMPADEPHALRAITEFKMMLVMIRT